MKVYVITNGEYSDYQICAVTLDKEQAELLKIRYSDKYDTAYIEEYDTDDYKMEVDDIYKHMYRISFNINHEIASCCTCSYINVKHGEVDDRSTWFKYSDSRRSCFNYNVTVFVEAEDEDHAKKIAKDIYMKWLAEQNDL